MDLFYDDIVIQKKRILEAGVLTISENQITAIVGSNGCGKTSLAKKIFCDSNHEAYDMAFVDQSNHAIVTNISVLHNISMTFDEKKNEKIKKQIEDLGFGDLLEHKAGKLSGGEKRLVSLLRGILAPQRILIIDEPTNDLDYEIVGTVIELLQKIKNTKTIVVISHDDRVLSVSSMIYQIKGGKLCLLSSTADTKEKHQPLQKPFLMQVKDLTVLQKLFRYNWVSLMLALVFMVMVTINMADYKTYVKEEEMFIPQNQINVFFPMSTYLERQDRVYPLSLMETIGTLNPVVQLKTVNRIDKLMKEWKGFFYWELDSEENFTVYPLEYYDPVAKKTYRTMDYYLETYCDASPDTAMVNTERFFEQTEVSAYDIQAVYPFEVGIFQQCVDDLQAKKTSTGENLILMSAAVVMKDGHSASEFFSSEQVAKYADKTLLVTSNEVIRLLRQIYLLKDLVHMGSRMLALMAVFGIVEALYMCLYLKIQKNTIFVAKNYGFAEEEMKEHAVARINSRYIRWILMLLFLCMNILYFSSLEAMQTNYIFSIFVAMFLSMTFAIDKKIITKYISKDYRWYAR